MLSALLVLVACNKEAKEEVLKIPDGWETTKQKIVINEKLYEVDIASNPKGQEIKYLNAPEEVEKFFEEFEETFIPHYVLGGNVSILYYYKDAKDFANHVTFESDEESNVKSLNGASVQVFEHINSSGQGYGTSLINTNDSYSWFHIPTDNGLWGYGARRCYVGSTMNDKASAVSFYMYNGDRPITFVGYLDAYGNESCTTQNNSIYYETGSRRIVAITKMPALQPNGAWIAQNTARLPNISRTCCKSWNDCISAYHFVQTTNVLISNVYVN